MIKKLLLSALFLIVMLLVIFIGSAYFMLGTDRGFKWTTTRLQNFDERLSLAPTTGNLDTGIGTDQIQWQDDKLDITADGIESRWRSGCLLKTHFCLEYLNIKTLRVELKPGDTSSNSTPAVIELPDILLPLRITADELHIERFELQPAQSGEAKEPLVIEDIRLSHAEASGSEIAFDKLVFAHRNYDVELGGGIKLKGEYPIDIDVNVIATDVYETHDFKLNAQLDNTLTNLDVHAGLSGAAHVLLNADVQPLQPTLPLRGNLTWKEIGWPLDTRDVVKSNNGRLIIAGSLDDYHLRLETALEGSQVPSSELKLKGRVNTERVLLPEVDLVLLDGVATASAALSWHSGSHWVADLVFRQLNPGKQWEQMQGQLDGSMQVRGSADNGSWATIIDNTDITGELRGFPFSLTGSAARTRSGSWVIPKINLANGANNLVLAGSASDELDINLDMDFATIHTLIPGIAGNIKATANINGPVSSPSLVLGADTSLLKAGNALFRDLEIEANVQDAGQSTSDIKINIGRLTSGGQEVDSIVARLTGTRDDHNIDFSLNGPQDTAVKLLATGKLPDVPESTYPSGDWLGSLRSASLTLPGHQLQLSNPAGIKWQQDNKRVEVSAHCWQDQNASLCLKDNITGSPSGTANVSIENYRLRRLDQYLGDKTRLEGRLSADSVLNWDTTKEDGFSVELTAAIDNGAVVVMPATQDQQPLRLRYETLNLKTRADPFTVVSELSLTSQQLGSANIDLTLNPKNPDKEILGKVALQGLDVKLARPFLANFDEVDGRIDASGDISGTLSEPNFTGEVVLSNPVLLSDDLPLGIEGGQFTAKINGQQAALDGTFDTGKGELSIDGDAGWQRDTWSATLNVNGEGLSIRQKPLVSSEVNPALRIVLSPEKITVSGTVDVPAAVVDIKERDVSAASLSEDVIIIEDEDLAKSSSEDAENDATPGGPDIGTNITVNLGDQVNLQGYGLNARLTGNIQVNKSNDDPPQLGGQINIAEGFYKSYGQDLEVTDGQILFIGPIEQTRLDISAVRTIDNEDRVAGLQLGGPIADPTVTLFTEPADKTQESILSYIVLGRDLGGSSTSEESSLLAQAAVALTVRQGRGFATGFAESLGISDFQIDASGSGDDTQVVVSGRLSRKLLLRYGRSVFAPDQTLFLRYDISKRLYLEAAQGIERAVDLFYSYSF